MRTFINNIIERENEISVLRLANSLVGRFIDFAKNNPLINFLKSMIKLDIKHINVKDILIDLLSIFLIGCYWYAFVILFIFAYSIKLFPLGFILIYKMMILSFKLFILALMTIAFALMYIFMVVVTSNSKKHKKGII